MTIPKIFEEAFAHVMDLAARFGENKAAFLSPRNQEAEVRQDFQQYRW